MEPGREEVDLLIKAAFDHGKTKTPLFTELGGLDGFEAIFPSRMAPSLSKLAQLQTPARRGGATPFMKVTLGFGAGFTKARDVFAFYHAIMHFDTLTEFTSLMQNGHTILITGGHYHGIAAAASFVIANDGLFIDAMAVSRGTQSVHVAPNFTRKMVSTV